MTVPYLLIEGPCLMRHLNTKEKAGGQNHRFLSRTHPVHLYCISIDMDIPATVVSSEVDSRRNRNINVFQTKPSCWPNNYYW